MVRSLRYRVTKLVVREIAEYLYCESEWQPKIEETHFEDQVVTTFTFPNQANLPTVKVTIETQTKEGEDG